MIATYKTVSGDRDVTRENFDQLRRHVKRDLLDFYDRANAWRWYYLTDNNVTLSELAYAFHRKDHRAVARLIDRGTLTVHTSLKFIPGSEFHCIYYQDVIFFLEPCGMADETDGIEKTY
jgi:hypothetical protein